jgi:hypothetical protein
MEKHRAIMNGNVSYPAEEAQDQAAESSSRPTRKRRLPIRLAGPEWQR